MKSHVLFYFSLAFTLLAGLISGQAQAPATNPTQPTATNSTQPLNSTVSDFGTSFIYSPPPICSKCIQTELGFLSVSDGRYLPTVITIAPFNSKTDFSALVNVLDSELTANHRVTQFGNRFDFIMRQDVYEKGGFLLSAGPRGTVFSREVDGGRIGATIAPQYSKGNNLEALNFTWTTGIEKSTGNPASDYVGAFDYYRTLDKHGTQFFLGLQHEATQGGQTVGTEQGAVIPFRNGQVECELGELNLNVKTVWQFQTRVIFNWGKVLAPKTPHSRN